MWIKIKSSKQRTYVENIFVNTEYIQLIETFMKTGKYDGCGYIIHMAFRGNEETYEVVEEKDPDGYRAITVFLDKNTMAKET